jgi:hypothetical protein
MGILRSNNPMNNRPSDVFSMRRLPARLGAEETAALLGFQLHDLPILMRAKLLRPLGKPAPNAPKFFATVEVLKAAEDWDWLDKATKTIASCRKEYREAGGNNKGNQGNKTGNLEGVNTNEEPSETLT